MGSSRRTVVWRLAGYATTVGVLIAVVILTGSLPEPEEARDWADGLGDWAYLAFVPLFVVVNFVITWPILAGAAGLLFGTAVGTPLALAGVTAASLDADGRSPGGSPPGITARCSPSAPVRSRTS